MQELLKNWWQLRTSTDAASRETAILMELWLEGYEEYAMEQVGEICKLVRKNWREVIELETLDLENNNLPSLPFAIGSLKSLERLDLDSNNITSLPAEIGKMRSLIWLYLSDNNLTTLPAEIGNLQGLKRLFLQDNPIPETEQQRIRSLLPNCKIFF